MSATVQLQLLVPGLCGPLPDNKQLEHDPVLIRLFNTLARARVATGEENNAIEKDNAVEKENGYALLSTLFAMHVSAEFPAAALSLSAYLQYKPADMLFGSTADIAHYLQAGYYFLHADPVHLRVEMDHAILQSPADLQLTPAETIAFCEQQQAHFSADGIHFFATDASHCYVCIKKPQLLHTTRLQHAIGRNIHFILPAGEDAIYWKQFLNESQMLLFNHPANQRREQTGQLTLNSLWLHGGGCLPAAESRGTGDIDLVCANDFLLAGLADYFKIPWCEIDDIKAGNWSVDFYRRIKNYRKPLLYFDCLLPWLHYTDTRMWQQQVNLFYQYCLLPLLVLVRQGKLNIDLYPLNDTMPDKKYHFHHYYACRFWRRAKIKNYVDTY